MSARASGRVEQAVSSSALVSPVRAGFLALLALIAVGVGVAAAGCRAPLATGPASAEAAEPVPWHPAGQSLEGRRIDVAVFGTEGPGVLFIGTIHGDEAAGTPLLVALAERLAQAPDWLAGRRVVVVPLLNPDGHAQKSRGNARGVDLNRNFPAANWHATERHGAAPLSEPETRALVELARDHGIERILSFHQAADLIDYDGPGAELAAALAAVSPLRLAHMGARPGSLGSWAGMDGGIPVITVELPRAADVATSAELWELYGPLLVAAIRHPFADGGEEPRAAGS